MPNTTVAPTPDDVDAVALPAPRVVVDSRDLGELSRLELGRLDRYAATSPGVRA